MRIFPKFKDERDATTLPIKLWRRNPYFVNRDGRVNIKLI
jgi:hypothetical protein